MRSVMQNSRMATLRDEYVRELIKHETQDSLAEVRQLLIDLLDVFEQTVAEDAVIAAHDAFNKVANASLPRAGFVIRFDNGDYNNNGFEVGLWDATVYETKQLAMEACGTLTGVKSVIDLSTGKDVLDCAAMGVEGCTVGDMARLENARQEDIMWLQESLQQKINTHLKEKGIDPNGVTLHLTNVEFDYGDDPNIVVEKFTNGDKK